MSKKQGGSGTRNGGGSCMLKKIKELVLSGAKLARYYEEQGAFENAYKEYLNIGDFVKAGEMLEKMEKWREAANLYIKHNQIDRARKSIDYCFRSCDTGSWQTYEAENNKPIAIEAWLKQKRQVQRFVRYVKFVEKIDDKGIPRVIHLADKLKQAMEFKGAADLYKAGFNLVNKEKETKSITNEMWLNHAVECMSRAKFYAEAAEIMKELILTEVNIGEAVSVKGYNPYRDYTHNLKNARGLNILPQLIKVMGDFDPFNLSYDLIKIGETELSKELLFRYYGKILQKNVSDEEMIVRNKKIQYCLNQYVVFYSQKGEFKKAAEIALLNSQKELAANLYAKAEQEVEEVTSGTEDDLPDFEEEEDSEIIEVLIEETKSQHLPNKEIFKCTTCGKWIEETYRVCPHCGNVLYLDLCVCGEKLKPHLEKCPACQRKIDQPGKPIPNSAKPEDDTRPYRIFSG